MPYSVDNLSQITSEGFKAASFVEIKDAIARKMQELYGFDIDISAASADGQFVMAEALIVNNIYRTLESIQANLKPGSASGRYLDVLASFTNTRRRHPTFSEAQLYVKNTGTEDMTPATLTFVDKSGGTWIWVNPVNLDGNASVTFEAGNTYAITVRATSPGPIVAAGGQIDPAGAWELDPYDRNCDIYQTAEVTNLDVYQKTDAAVGSYEESDASLRSRRIYKSGVRSETVADTLRGRLLDLTGIKEAWVFNNNTPSPVAMGNVYGEADNATTVPSHNIYVAVRLEENVQVDPVLIGNVIYTSMTPGVLTTANTSTATGKSYQVQLAPNVSTTVNWKQCQPIANAQVIVKFGKITDDGDLTDPQKAAIVTAATDYLENVAFYGTMSMDELSGRIKNSDFKSPITGLSTYEVNSAEIKIGTTLQTGNAYQMPLAYFKVDSAVWTTANGQATLTLSTVTGE